MRLKSYVEGEWRSGTGEGRPLLDPTTGEELGQVDATGVDVAAALAHARETGGPGAIRKASAGADANLKPIEAWRSTNFGRTFVDEQPKRIWIPSHKIRGEKFKSYALICPQKARYANKPLAGRMPYDTNNVEIIIGKGTGKHSCD